MSSAVADRAPVQKMTSLTMAPKPRLNFLSAACFTMGGISKLRLARLLLDGGKADTLGASPRTHTCLRDLAARLPHAKQALNELCNRDQLYEG